jgi:RNA polymerase sigma-70 factor (TIGR02943 family)
MSTKEIATMTTGDETPVSIGPAAHPERWVDEHGDYLFHFALSRLRNPTLAEDFVQEALLAGIKALHRFEGRSTERSWLTGILRNKILDHFRRAGRETTFTDLDFHGDEETRSFEDRGFLPHWAADRAPGEWGGTVENLDRDEFWKAFNHCTAKLPERSARVFLMREVDDTSTEEICAALGITPNNLWVMLHRARFALRRCLEVAWLGRTPESTE